ncbi:hypothetical protein ACH4SK_40150 [Streptomyces inhibens]|uniref:hypothetical protein n=1 Tax=Streptomyces inhibens TaxID=2293571 RepID=UPI00379DD5A9
MLAVVQHQQRLPVPQIVDEPGRGIRAGAAVPHRPHHREVQQLWLAELGQGDQLHTVGVGPPYLARRLYGRPGLAHPARTRQRHQP